MDQQPMLAAVIQHLNAAKGRWQEVSDACGVPYSTLCKIAQGHTVNPGVAHVQALYDHFRAEKASA